MELNFDSGRLNTLMKRLMLDVPNITKAFNRALRETLRYAERHVKGSLRGTLPPNVLKARIRSRFKNETGTVFAGLNPIPIEAMYPSKIKATTGGLMTPEGLIADAFINRRTNHYKQGRVYRRIGKGRLPIERVTKAIFDEGVQAVEQAFTDMEAYFDKRFEHHLYFYAGKD
jgi:hypothetical protein